MTAWQAVQSLITLLSGTAPHVSAQRPSAAGDLPGVVVAVSEASDSGSGLGGLVATRKLSDTAWSSVTASRCTGVFALELWAADTNAVNTLADAVMNQLIPDEAFLRLNVQSVGPIDVAPLGFGGSATALKLPLGVAFVHETPLSEDIGPGGIVKTVHVEMSDDFHEVMDIDGGNAEMAEAITEMVLPSTYIEVRAEGLIGVSGIVTGNVAVVGTASRGPIDEPVVLSTFTDARQIFGDYDAWVDGASGELTLVRALQQVFGNGGSTVYAVRTAAAGAGPSSRALLKAADTVVTLTAVTDGTWGDSIKVQAKAASGNAFVQSNEQTVAATPLKPLHANIAVSPRNVIRVKKGLTGQTFRYPLTVGGAAAAGKPTVKANGDLAFAAADTPVAGDVITAAYEVEQASSRDIVVSFGNVKETYTVADANDLAADIALSSTLVSATVAAAQGGALPDTMTDAVPLTGGGNGEGASTGDYATSLALLDEEAINLVVLAGQGCSAAAATLLASVETAENHGHDRIAIVGADSDATGVVLGNADTVGDDRLILVAPGIVADDLTADADAKLPPAYAAAAMAGLIAGLAPQASPTNKTLAVTGLTTLYNDGQLKQLVGGRVLALQRRSGYRVVKGITTDDGPFRQISVRRIVDYAKAGTRAGSMPYIGRLNNARVRGALQATLNGFLADMVLNEQLTEFTLTVTATREQEIAGIALVTMLLKPTFSIDYVKVIMNLS